MHTQGHYVKLNLSQEKHFFEQVAPKVAKHAPLGQSREEETNGGRTSEALAPSPKTSVLFF